MEWISVKDRLPNSEECRGSEYWDFLCRVMIPERGGLHRKESMIIKFDQLDNMWECEGPIVTHWMCLPKAPTD